MNNKLIIWDFDGVIADTEKLWMSVWIKHLEENYKEEKHSEEYWYTLFAGMSDDGKAHKLKETHNINIGKDELYEIFQKEIDRMYQGMDLTPNILELFKETKHQCVGTGGPYDATLEKVKLLDIGKYFSKNNIFARDMVKNGKPAPDIFLLAAKTMGFSPRECIVVEDSVSGIIAATKAEMSVIAFLEHHHTGRENVISKAKDLGVNKFANNMKELKMLLNSKGNNKDVK